MGKKFTVRLFKNGEECAVSADVDSLSAARRWANLASGAADNYTVHRNTRLVARYTRCSDRWVRTWHGAAAEEVPND